MRNLVGTNRRSTKATENQFDRLEGEGGISYPRKNTVELSQEGKEYRDQTRKRGNLTTRNNEFGGVIEIAAKNT